MNPYHTQNRQQHTFRAMGSEINLWLETPHPREAQVAFNRVEMLFAANEDALSRFRPHSELSRLNAHSNEWVVVSPLLWDVLLSALGMAAITNGYFDPTILNALEGAGYTDSFELLETAVTGSTFSTGMQSSGGWSGIQLDDENRAVFLPPGVRVDLGGIGKGYTANEAIRLLQAWGPCLVDAGGDLVVGPAPAGCAGWPVAITAPWTTKAAEPVDLFHLWLADATLATSGIDYRQWMVNGRPAHHLINPFTGQPATTDLITVTVLTGRAEEAEAWATAVLVAGAKDGMDMLLDAELAGFLITRDGSILATTQMDHHLQTINRE